MASVGRDVPSADAARPAASLFEIHGPHPGRSYLVEHEVVRLGRNHQNEITLVAPQVSRIHAEIRWTGTGYELVDLGSKNGTLLNCKPISGAAALHHGDEIRLPAVTLRFELVEATAAFSFSEGPSGARGLVIDRDRARATLDGREVELTAKEFMLLVALDDRRGRLLKKDDLARAVWPEYHGDVSDENIEQLISRLRHKLEQSGGRRYLTTKRGLGYVLEP
jgi:pSer/pThr/pTyr-binding forkhead associated (FHA) protein